MVVVSVKELKRGKITNIWKLSALLFIAIIVFLIMSSPLFSLPPPCDCDYDDECDLGQACNIGSNICSSSPDFIGLCGDSSPTTTTTSGSPTTTTLVCNNDGIRDANEACDGYDFEIAPGVQSKDCSAYNSNWHTGTLRCNNCVINTNGCCKDTDYDATQAVEPSTRPYEPGTVTKRGVEYLDECIIGTNKLKEQKCNSGGGNGVAERDCPLGCYDDPAGGPDYCIRCIDNETMTVALANSPQITPKTLAPPEDKYHRGKVSYATFKDENGDPFGGWKARWGVELEINESCLNCHVTTEVSCKPGVNNPNFDITQDFFTYKGSTTIGDITGTLCSSLGCSGGACVDISNPPSWALGYETCFEHTSKRCDPANPLTNWQRCTWFGVNIEEEPGLGREHGGTGWQCEPCWDYCSAGVNAPYGCDQGGSLPEPYYGCWMSTHCMKDAGYYENPSEYEFYDCTPVTGLLWGVETGPGNSGDCFMDAPVCSEHSSSHHNDSKLGICHFCDEKSDGCTQVCGGQWNQHECCDSHFYDDWTMVNGERVPLPDCGVTANNQICDAPDYRYLDPYYMNTEEMALAKDEPVRGQRFPGSEEGKLYEGGQWYDGSASETVTLLCDNMDYLYNGSWHKSEGTCTEVNTSAGNMYLDYENSTWGVCNPGTYFTTLNCSANTYICTIYGWELQDAINCSSDIDTCTSLCYGDWSEDTLECCESYVYDDTDCATPSMSRICDAKVYPADTTDHVLLFEGGSWISDGYPNEVVSLTCDNCSHLYDGQAWHKSNGSCTEVNTTYNVMYLDYDNCSWQACTNLSYWTNITCGNDQYYCTDLGWQKNLELRCTPDKSTCSYCTSPDMCLLNPLSTKNEQPNPRCIPLGEYYSDDYCLNGTWSTRTALIATQLLNFASTKTDYTLFCDTPQYAANNYQDLSLYGDGGSWLQGVNKLCTLEYKEGSNRYRAFGTSINDQQNYFINTDYGFLPVILKFSKDYCDSAVHTDNKYYRCGTNNSLWLNNDTYSVIYSRKGINLDGSLISNVFITFRSLLYDPITSIINTIKGLFTPTIGASKIHEFLEDIHDFDQVYYKKVGTKEVRGFVRQEADCAASGVCGWYISVNYFNFNYDVCNKIAQWDLYDGISTGNPMEHEIHCTQSANNYHVVSHVDEGGEFQEVGQIWTDLTSKLRIE